MPLPTLTVKLDGPVGKGGTFLLDGHDISGGLKELHVHVVAGNVTTAHLGIFVGELEMDAKTLAILAATVKAPAEPEAEAPALPTFGEEPCHA